MPALEIAIIIATINLMVLSVLGFYIWSLNKEKKRLEKREKELIQKESLVASGYQQIIDRALNEERKIVQDTSKHATDILTNTQLVSNTSKQSLDTALQKITADIQNQANSSSSDYLTKYKSSLNEVSTKSLTDFQNYLKQFESDMQKQMKDFRSSLLPQIQNELENYKKEKFREADKKVDEVVRKVAEKVLNKTLSSEDHQKLIIDSLERARKEGVFD